MALVQYQGEDVAEKNFPPTVKELIPRCCAHDPESRPTAKEALQLLEDMQIEDDHHPYTRRRITTLP